MGNYITPLLNVAASAVIFKVALNKYQKLSVLLAFFGVIYMIIVYGKVPYIALFFAVNLLGFYPSPQPLCYNFRIKYRRQ